MDNHQDLIENFMREVEDREQRKIMLSREERLVAAKKSKELQPIRELLQKFVNMGIHVKHGDHYNYAARKSGPPDEGGQAFVVYEVDSSLSWSPGVSIWFDHPAQIEVAIPNKKEEGVVVIKVASEHPDAYILEKKYYDMKSACESLTRFLAKNTVSVKHDPRKIHEDRKSTPPAQFFSGAPTLPPNAHTNTHTNAHANTHANMPSEAPAIVNKEIKMTGPYNPVKIQEEYNNNKNSQKPFSLKSLDTLINRQPPSSSLPINDADDGNENT